MQPIKVYKKLYITHLLLNEAWRKIFSFRSVIISPVLNAAYLANSTELLCISMPRNTVYR